MRFVLKDSELRCMMQPPCVDTINQYLSCSCHLSMAEQSSSSACVISAGGDTKGLFHDARSLSGCSKPRCPAFTGQRINEMTTDQSARINEDNQCCENTPHDHPPGIRQSSPLTLRLDLPTAPRFDPIRLQFTDRLSTITINLSSSWKHS